MGVEDDLGASPVGRGAPAGTRGPGLWRSAVASVLPVVAGCFSLIYGIAAIAGSHVFTANAHYVFGNLRSWDWLTLTIGVWQLLAAAVAVLGLNAIGQMLVIPVWPLVIIAVGVVALYGLCRYGSFAHLGAV